MIQNNYFDWNKIYFTKNARKNALTLSGPGGGAESALLRFFLHNSKTPGDIEK